MQGKSMLTIVSAVIMVFLSVSLFGLTGYEVSNTVELPYFTVSEQPNIAENPSPADSAFGVSIELERLEWDYISRYGYTNPLGFRVYFSDTDEFDDGFVWVAYDEDEENYSTAAALPEELDYYTDYYWKVVPTTIDPEDDDRSGSRNRRSSQLTTRNSQLTTRGDAENVPIWTFRTEEDTSVETAEPKLITELKGNYPNPFNPYTSIEFSICKDTQAELVIYNIRGQLVKTLHSGYIQAGDHRLSWNGKDDNGRDVGSGIFFYRLTTDHYDNVHKMLLVK